MPTQNEPPIHPAALLMPLMTAEEYAQLRADIREHGLLEPIVMFDGQILDGRHRWRACMDEGIPPHTEEWDGKGTPIEFVISKNLHRRHLTPGQRGMIGVPIAEYIAATEGKAAQQRAAAVTNAVLGRSSRETLVHNCEQASPPTSLLTDIDSTTAAPDVLAPSPRSPRTRKSIAKAGALVGVSHNTIARAAAVAKADPELADRVKAGTMTMSAAYKQVQAKADEAQITVVPNGTRPYDLNEDRTRLEFRRLAPDARKITKLRAGDVAGAFRIPHERKELVAFLNAMQHWCSLVERAMKQAD